jgi:hypothetical protein
MDRRLAQFGAAAGADRQGRDEPVVFRDEFDARPQTTRPGVVSHGTVINHHPLGELK